MVVRRCIQRSYSPSPLCSLFVALAFPHQLNPVTGGILIAVFALYIISIGYAISRGVTEPSQLSDSDSDDELPTGGNEQSLGRSGWLLPSENSPLLGNTNPAQEIITATEHDIKQPPRPIYQHILQLFLGLLALSLSGYILAHSAGAIADSLQLSGTVFGITVIAFATTLPEKLLSVLSGFAGKEA